MTYNGLNVRQASIPAIGDGVADDRAALQSAVDAVALAGGGDVFVPAGTYLVRDSVFLRSKARLVGEGAASVITCPPDGWPLSAVALNFGILMACNIADAGVERLHIRGTLGGFTATDPDNSANDIGGSRIPKLISGGRGRTQGIGPYTGGEYVGQVERLVVRDCDFSNCLVEAIWLNLGGAGCFDPQVDGCRFRDCGLPAYGGGLPSVQTVGVGSRVTNCLAENVGCFTGLGGRDSIVANNVVRNPYFFGLTMGDAGDLLEGDVTVIGNHIEVDVAARPTFRGGIYLAGGEATDAGNAVPFRAIGNTIRIVNPSSSIYPVGIKTRHIRHAIVQGNNISIGGHGDGILIQPQPYAIRVSSSGNVITSKNPVGGPPNYGITATASTPGVAMTVHSVGDEFWGFTSTPTGYALHLRATAGTMRASVRNAWIDSAAYVRLGDSLAVRQGDYDGAL